MKKIFQGVLVAAVLAVSGFAAAPVMAQAVVAMSEKTSAVAADQTVDGSAFLAGDAVTVAGTVKGDVYCAGGTVLISGVVEGDVLCAGQSVTIAGTVKGDVRAAAMTLVMQGTVEKNATLFGQTVLLEQTNAVKNDVTVGGSIVRLAGTVGRDARVGAMTLDLGGTVVRHFEGEVENLQATSAARVGGNMTYWSSKDGVVPQGVVAGEVHRYQPAEYEEEQAPSVATFVSSMVTGIAFLMILTLFIVLVVPRTVRRLSDYSWKRIWLPLLVGMASLFVALPLIVLLLLSIVGLPVALLLVVVIGLMLLVAGPLSAYYIGRWLLEGRSTNMIVSALLGSLVLGTVAAIPFVGGLVVFLALATGIGMVVLSLRSEFTGKPLYADAGGERKIERSGERKITRSKER